MNLIAQAATNNFFKQHLNSLLGVGGIALVTTGLAFVTAGWRNVISFVNRIKEYIIVQQNYIDCHFASRAIFQYIHQKSHIPFGQPKILTTVNLFKKDESNKQTSILARLFPSSCLMRIGWRFFMYQNQQSSNIKIKYIRGIFKSDHFINIGIKSLQQHNNRQIKKDKSRHNYYIRHISGTRFNSTYGQDGKDVAAKTQSNRGLGESASISPPSSGDGNYAGYYKNSYQSDIHKCGIFLGFNKQDFISQKVKNCTNCYFLSQDLQQAVKQFEKWNSLQTWYNERSIAWKRGWLICGKPGSGKSAFVKYLASEFGFPIFIFDLASMTNKDLTRQWRNVRCSSPCICLFQDIDSVYNGRSNVTDGKEKTPGVSFDCFLNTLDGVDQNSGIFTILTTNCPQKLDQALAKCELGDNFKISPPSRPGRIDNVIQIGKATHDIKLRIAQKILDKWLHLVDSVMQQGLQDTAAQMQERCIRIAQVQMWEDDKNQHTKITKG